MLTNSTLHHKTQLNQSMTQLWSLYNYSDFIVRTMQEAEKHPANERILFSRSLESELFDQLNKTDTAIHCVLDLLSTDNRRLATHIEQYITDKSRFSDEQRQQFYDFLGRETDLIKYLDSLPEQLYKTLADAKTNAANIISEFAISGHGPATQGRCRSGGLLGEKGGCFMLGALTIAAVVIGNPIAAAAGLGAGVYCCT